MKTWLLFDMHFLSWRAHHTTGKLSHEGNPTGIAFGVLREIETQVKMHSPEICIFAFDHGYGLRQQIDPNYKSSRRNKQRTEEEQEILESFHQQVKELRDKILPGMGYKNIFRQKGYEADDIIAAVARDLPEDTQAVIISADEDLWQCVTDRVFCYNPIKKEKVTFDSFVKKWGIDPVFWANVKALAGCKSDDVVGIEGIGEATASKWFNGSLKPGSAKYGKIDKNIAVMFKNMPLVRLPFEGTNVPEIRPDEVTQKKKMEMEASLGIRSSRRPKKRKEKPKQRSGFDI